MTSESSRKAWETKRKQGYDEGLVDGRREGLADGHLNGREQARAALVRSILAAREIGVSRGFPSPRQRTALANASDDAIALAVLGASSESDFMASLD